MASIKELKKRIKKFIRRSKKFYFRTMYYLFCAIVPIKRNTVAFLSDSRSDLTGNFEYISKEIALRSDAFQQHFVLNKTNNAAKSLIMYTKIAWLIATSRYVLLDDFYPLIYPLKIRDGVDLVQVWHAVGAFKTFGFSRIGRPGGPNPNSKNHRNYTKSIVSSHNVVPFYAEGFGIDADKIYPIGIPRTDMFFDEKWNMNTRAEMHRELPFIAGKKVILFAPTFRGNGQTTANYNYNWIDYQALYEQLMPENYVFLFKMHPFIKKMPEIPDEYQNFFYDVSDYREVNNLLLITDILITDYSSVVFEYSLLNKKSLFYTPDLDEYTKSRDFYVDYEDFVPGPIAEDMPDLIDAIKHVDDQDNDLLLTEFLQYYFDALDGKSTKRFVDALETNFKSAQVFRDSVTK